MCVLCDIYKKVLKLNKLQAGKLSVRIAHLTNTIRISIVFCSGLPVCIHSVAYLVHHLRLIQNTFQWFFEIKAEQARVFTDDGR